MRRVAWVLLAYGVVALLVVRGAAWLRRVLALPPLFDTLGIGLLVVGVPVAAALAWWYPRLGQPHSGGAGPHPPPTENESGAADR